MSARLFWVSSICECKARVIAHHGAARKPCRRRALFVTGATHRDTAQSITADLARSAEREIENPAAGKRAAVLNRTPDLFAIVEIGDDEDRAKGLGAMRAGHFVGLEALAAGVPLVFPVDRGLLIVRRRPGHAAHPHLLKTIGAGRRRAQGQRERGELHLRNTSVYAVAIRCHDANNILSGPARILRVPV